MRKQTIRRSKRIARAITILVLFIIALVLAILLITNSCQSKMPNGGQKPGIDGWFGEDPTETPEPTPVPTPTLPPIPNPAAVDGTKAENFGLQPEMQLNGESISSYTAPADLSFGETNEYSNMEGVITFRGNNFRSDPTYGTAGAVSEKKLEVVWAKDIPGTIAKGNPSDGSWFGCGWTGQPLIVRWPESTRRVMNIFDGKKSKDGLIEVIYATENGYIYFYDLNDGESTRDKINGQWTFKGSGSLDPRGYPLLYVGAGDDGPNGHAQNMIFSLIDGKKLYSYGADDPFAHRSFKAFDAATLVHAGSDMVTYASESGIIYQFKLNTVYDEQAGTISVNPTDIMKWRYTTERSRKGLENNTYWLGFESSPIIWRNYMYVSDNCGDLLCIDTNTMQVVWIQDVLDDTNCTPVFEVDEKTRTPYIYIGTSLHWMADGNDTGYIPFWKINGITGEIEWKSEPYRCSRNSNISGGIQDTAAIGKNNLSDLVFVNYAKTIDIDTHGIIVAYDKNTGAERWKKNLDGYSWSSPIVMYDDVGNGYVVTFDSAGKMYLFDGKDGTLLDKLELEGNFEASPAAFDNMIVIGTRKSKIYGIKLK
ncbi:MAG: PQQ-binding-like beta-propeller repeat protein [Clostridia bacterium]